MEAQAKGVGEIERSDHDRDIARIDREITDLRMTIQRLDEHGSRGVLGLSIQVAELIKDVGKLEAHVEAIDRKVSSRPRWQTFLAAAGLIAPVYAFIIQQMIVGLGRR
jgi:hypothetical protein